MEIQGRTVLVLGGWGLVGAAICRELLPLKPARLVVSSLNRAEAEEAVAQYRREFPGVEMIPAWGSIFVRQDFKDVPWGELIRDPGRRAALLSDSLSELTPEILHASMLYRLFQEHRPEVVVDCINSATVFAYQDMYRSNQATLRALEKFDAGGLEPGKLRPQVEESLLLGAIPQLIRHTQILLAAMQEFATRIYVKIGTSGTGGMGLNIPYTHSEEKPSRMLLTKSAIAGAHTMLLFLMARTPGGPIIKEFKPTAAIAWKHIGFGPVRRRGRRIGQHRIGMDEAVKLGERFRFPPPEPLAKRMAGENAPELEEVFIDTGENGSFCRAEFEAITTIGQMEFITPEEIARQVVFEITGGNTGHDVLDGLDMACMGPTYRAGAVREAALAEMRRLEAEKGSASVAFENLGPPRLSKLLYEAHLMRRTLGTLAALAKADPAELSHRVTRVLEEDEGLRTRILSIGIPILLPDGERLLRGAEVHIPPHRGEDEIPMGPVERETWAQAGWIDLRPSNMERWKARAQAAVAEAEAVPPGDRSSRYHRDRGWWHVDQPLDEGRTVGWIFIAEEKGLRMKR